MKDVKTERTYTDITYIGNCPICMKEQASQWQSNVDKECTECKTKRMCAAKDYFYNLLKSVGIDVSDYNSDAPFSFAFNGKSYCIMIEQEEDYDGVHSFLDIRDW